MTTFGYPSWGRENLFGILNKGKLILWPRGKIVIDYIIIQQIFPLLLQSLNRPLYLINTGLAIWLCLANGIWTEVIVCWFQAEALRGISGFQQPSCFPAFHRENIMSQRGVLLPPRTQSENIHGAKIYQLPQFTTCGMSHSHLYVVLQLPTWFQVSFLLPLHNSQAESFPTPTSRSKFNDLFKVKCHIYCSIYVFLYHLTCVVLLGFYLF